MSASAQLMECSFVGCDFDIDLEDGSDEDGKEGEDHVVEGDGPREPEGLARTHGVKCEDGLDNSENHVFIEEVKNHLSNSDVIQPTVMKQQLPEKAKLSNCIVSYLCSSCSFLAKDTYPYVCLHYHINIVCTVTDC